MSEKINTCLVRFSFPNLFKTDKNDKHTLAVLVPPADWDGYASPQEKADRDRFMDAARKQAGEVAAEKWGDKAKTMKLKSPFLDAGDFEYEGYEKGWTLLRLSSKQKPGVVGTERTPDGTGLMPLDESDIYPGCWGRVSVNAFAYDTDGNRGVAFGLNNVQKIRDGEPIGGRSRPENDFADPVPGGGESGESAEALFG